MTTERSLRAFQLLSAVLLVLLAWSFLSTRLREAPPKPPAVKRLPERTLTPVSFADLPGWSSETFQDLCRALRDKAGRTPKVAYPCGVPAAPSAWRAFFERDFRPYLLGDRGDPKGLFTGYYEPTLRGSRSAGGAYRYPLYRRPGDLVSVDLGKFRKELDGKRIAGRVVGTRLDPYPARAEIEAGALAGEGLELAFVDNRIDAFFLHIQGSGRIELDDGTHLRVGYDGQNGRPYTSIGKVLIERGALSRKTVSMQSIKAWLRSHRGEIEGVLDANESYIFFRELSEAGPVGSLGVPLTPWRSLAVDRRFIPLGSLLWLETTTPAGRPLTRLVVAQDTGGAIKGVVRGDLFLGHGEKAEEIAGRMKQPGRLFVLLPKGAPPEMGGER